MSETNNNAQHRTDKDKPPGTRKEKVSIPAHEGREISAAGRAFDYFYEVVSLLMSPEGCPWDREQTPSSMRKHILEETYELIEAIENRDAEHMDEEIGDLYLVVSMVLRMRELAGIESSSTPVTASDVFTLIADKLIRRHPHVFGDATADDSGSVKAQWDSIKENVEGKLPAESLNDEHRGFPPLARAQKLQKKAAKLGFDWPEASPVIEKVHEELEELKELLPKESTEPPFEGERERRVQEEIGDLLFSVVNLSRKLKVDPSLALESSTRKFAGRFDSVKQIVEKRGLVMKETPLEELDEIWSEVKGTPDREAH